MQSTQLKQQVALASEKPCKLMIDTIDTIGNKLGVLCSDAAALNALIQLFRGTVLEALFTVYAAEESASPELRAGSFKVLLVADALRLLQFLIYADDEVTDTELDAAYHLYKPLVKFFATCNSEYSRFENLERSAVFDFMHAHMQDQGINGGDIKLSRELFAHPSRINSLSKEEHRKLQMENMIIPLAMALKAAGEDCNLSAYFSAFIFHMRVIGQVTSMEDFRAANTQDISLTAAKYNLDVFERRTAMRQAMMQEISRCIESIPEEMQNQYFDEIQQGMARAKSTNAEVLAVSHFDSTISRCHTLDEPETVEEHVETGWTSLEEAVGEHIQKVLNERFRNSGVKFSIAKPISTKPETSTALETEPERALAEALQELETLVGLKSVKAEVTSFVAFLRVQKEREKLGLKTASNTLHYVFTGNPGTGKTTVARIFAKILYGYGILQSEKLTETDRSGLVAGYLGQTAIKTDEVVQEALDGVLFIDEAYSLAGSDQDKDAFGNEAIDTLLKRMEDNRDRLVVIVAGYTESMKEFLKSNPGLSSRFTRFLEFEDYSAAELTEIFLKRCEIGEFVLTESALVKLRTIFETAVLRKDGHFGNGRYVRNIFEQTTMRQSARLSELESMTREQLSTIEVEDIPTIKRMTASVEDILTEMETSFIGLQSVKDQIRRIAKRIAYNEREGLITDRKYNMQFVGNPGTGKTTIARYMSRVFNAVGLLEGTDVIEVAGTALKGSYVGQSKDAVIQHFQKAREEGKVLFIDEAHNLYKAHPGHHDSFAQEVIAQIVQETTAAKNARVFTILAGYPEEMRQLMDADTGLQRRFPEALTILFPDYTAEECLQILEKRLAQKRFSLDAEAVPALLDIIETMKRNPKFGNAGSMNNLADHLFDEHIMRDEETKVITIEDVKAIQ